MSRMEDSGITDHHDGFGLAESLTITKDQPGPGGASHLFDVVVRVSGSDGPDPESPDAFSVARIQFQDGHRNDPNATPGIIDTVLVAIVLDRLRAFQEGDFKCRENALAITKLEEGLMWMQARTRERAKRGALGTYKP